MKDLTQAIPGYRVYEYLLVLSPHEELKNKIMDVKKDFYEKYQAETARWGKPHLTLVNYVQYGMMEERIINHLKTNCHGFSSY